MTITADFSGGEKTATTEPLYQWDTGQKLALSGLPQTASDIQVHFANAAMAQAIVKATELVDSLPTCDIPNEFLQFGSAAKARAWVFYKTSSTEGYTVRTVLIPVIPRKRPNDYVSPEDPDSHGIVEQAIELLESYETDITGKEDVSNKKTTLTGNETSNSYYPSIKAVVDYLAANYLGSGDSTVKTENLDNESITVEKVADDLAAVINAKEVKSNKKTTLTGNESSNDYYPTTKAVADALSHSMGFLSSEIVNNATDTGKIYYTTTKKALIIPISNEFSQTQFRLDRDGKIYARRRSRPSTSVDFPAWDSFVDISAGVDSETIEGIIRQIVEAYIAEHGIDLTGVERTANKVTAIGSGSTDTQYPSALAVKNYVDTALGVIENGSY